MAGIASSARINNTVQNKVEQEKGRVIFMKSMRHAVTVLLFAVVQALMSASAHASCLVSVDAAVNWGNGKAYFFGYIPDNDQLNYVRYDIKADKADPGYPKPVNNSTWPGLGLDTITAAVNGGNGKAYFFGYIDGVDELQYVSYDIKTDRADEGYPYPVDDVFWPDLSDLSDITATLDLGDGFVIFMGYNGAISENQLGILYNINTFAKLDEVQEINPEEMGGSQLDFISSAVEWGDKFYLFGWIEGEDYPLYERFTTSTMTMDADYPRVMDSDMWPGMGCSY
jgi:matrix metalloproteinase-14 (membrane-inserted)